MWFVSIFLLLLVYLLYKYFLSPGKKPDWWDEHGIQEIDGSPVASQWDILLGRKNVILRDDYAYKMMTSNNLKFCGMVEAPAPFVLVRDLDLVKKIMIKDFDHFSQRRDFFTVPNKDSVIAKMLGMLKGAQWKGVRTSMSPTFSTSKIRRMMEHFSLVGKEWVEMLRCKATENGGSLNAQMMSCVNQYTIEVIGASVFGLSTGVFTNSESTFATMANRLVAVDFIQYIKFNLGTKFPSLFNLFGIEPLDTKAIRFFEGILKQSLEARVKDNDSLKRDDFLQLLLETRKEEGGKETVNAKEFEEDDVAIKGSHYDKSEYLTDDIIIAQALTFFLGGLFTTATLISFVAYALAAYPEIQEKLRKEVDSVMNEDESVSYDDLRRLIYLDMVCSEILRKFSSTLRIDRICQKDYYDQESGLFVKKDTMVCIPLNAIHHDPKYYEYPERFYPEHFSPEVKAKRSPYAFMPFGLGPRNCIGMRFALIESKAAIAHLVHKFRIEPTEKSPLPMEANVVSVFLSIPKDLELKLTPV